MGRKGGAQSINDLLDSGNRAGAKALVDANVGRDPSLHHRWEQAAVYCRLGLVTAGLESALSLRDTEAWAEIAPQVWDFTLWAGRPAVGTSLIEGWLEVIEQRGDINALPCSWQSIARAYLGLSWAAGTPERAEKRLSAHAELEDSGWRMGGNRDVVVRGPAHPMVESFLASTVAAVQGRFVSCDEFSGDYNKFLEALFGLAQLAPAEAWATLDRLEAQRTLHPLGAAYRAQVARRGGDESSAMQWTYAWFADPLFPMTVPDLVVTGLLRFFVEVRELWVAASATV